MTRGRRNAPITEAQYAAMLAKRGMLPGSKPAPTPRRGNMNKTEAQFAVYLKAVAQSERCADAACSDCAVRVDFEAERFRLADGTNYTPDFRFVVKRCAPEGAMVKWEPSRFYEVKPKARLRTERDGILRLKWAAQLNPMYEFYLARPDGHGWLVRRIYGTEAGNE